jgi:hypothetical protein
VNTNLRKHFGKALLIGAAAALFVSAGSTYADGNFASSATDRGTAQFKGGTGTLVAPEAEIEEYVLGSFRIERPDTRTDSFQVKTPETGIVRGSGDLQSPTGGANGGTGHDAADDFKAGPGCSIQCITSGKAYARGGDARLVVKTDTPARIWIHVQEANGSYYRVESSGADPVTEFGFTFDDLNDGNYYEAWAVARDEEGYEDEAHGGFMTLYRNVTITYTHANISERAYGSDAKFDMEVWLNGEFDDDLNAFNMEAEDYTLGLGIQIIELEWVNQYLDFFIQLYEAPDSCNNVGNPESYYFGPGSCSFISFAQLLEGENDLDARPAGADSWTEWTLERTMVLPAGLWPPYDDELHFEVPVTLHVEFKP